MAQPMSAILLKIATVHPLTPKTFAAALDDFEFNGVATRQEMTAFWKLASDCIEASDKSSDRRLAMFQMSAFAVIGQSAAFPKLDVKVIMYQMIVRLLKPERVDQRAFGLCGPAHFVVLLIKSKPRKYVSMAYDLLTTGKTTGDDGFETVPDEHVRDFEPKESIADADWLLAASLRNAQIPIPAGKTRGKYKGTKPAEIFTFFKHAGYERIVLLSCYQRTAEWMAHAAFGFSHLKRFEPADAEKTIANIALEENAHDPITNFRIACKLREIGWRVMLSCNEDLFKYEPSTAQELEAAKSGKPFDVRRVEAKVEARRDLVKEREVSPGIYMQNAGHWVLAKNIGIKGEKINMTVYTWGSQSTVQADLNLAEFANIYAGFVAAFG